MTDRSPGHDDDHVYLGIRRAIVEGRYPPGTRLIEQRLAEEFDVSRTPVREALHRLQTEGLVIVERNRGAQVRALTEEEISDLYDVRARLESYAAELAAERADARDHGALTAAADAFDRAVRTIDGGTRVEAVRRLDEANSAFHAGLLAASRHTRIRQLVGRAVDVPLVFQALRRFGPDDLARSNLFHHLILDAVVGREPVRAGRLMAEHVLQARDNLLGHLGDAGGVIRLFGTDDA